ncbi:hypothetical protein KSP39_PZI006145 [Platanthera zijinensis]|uniref:Uncharacterized protein n=1 Tax=Platanthera zijinensis TaxID=2320716 RepID=A0AAP0BRK1_9ASPA
MDPCPFIRLIVESLAIKLPPLSKSAAAAAGVHPSTTPCFCVIQLQNSPLSPPQTVPLPLASSTSPPISSAATLPAVIISLDPSAVHRLSVKPEELTVTVYAGRTGTTCGVSAASLLGRVRVAVDLAKEAAAVKPAVIKSGWVRVTGGGGRLPATLHLVVRSEPDPRFVFHFGGEPECSPVVFLIGGGNCLTRNGCLRQPAFSCRFSLDRRRISGSSSSGTVFALPKAWFDAAMAGRSGGSIRRVNPAGRIGVFSLERGGAALDGDFCSVIQGTAGSDGANATGCRLISRCPAASIPSDSSSSGHGRSKLKSLLPPFIIHRSRNRSRRREQRKGWSVTIHDLSGSPVAVASMITPFVPSPGSDRVSRANPGAWLILRPANSSSTTWKPCGRLEAWREVGPALGYRFDLAIDSGPTAFVPIAESSISFQKGGEFRIGGGEAAKGFVMGSTVGREGRMSLPEVQLGAKHVACMGDAAVFVALAAAVDLSMDACQLFSRKLRKELSFCDQQQG